MNTNLKIIKLKNRSLLEIKGDDSREFLQALVTNNINLITNKNSIYSALLSPQGKYLYDFFIFQHYKNGHLIIDCEKKIHDELIQKLNMYKLRSQIEITINNKIDVYCIYGNELTKLISNIGLFNIEGFTKSIYNNLYFVDPRNKNLGIRNYTNNLIKEFRQLPAGTLSEWNYNRIKLRIPTPSIDLEKEKSFIIENNFEEINSIDFNKGCYIGQENTARQKYRGTAKRKLALAKINGKSIINGEEIYFDEKKVGKIRSSSKELVLVSIKTEIYDYCKKNKFTIKINDSELEFI